MEFEILYGNLLVVSVRATIAHWSVKHYMNDATEQVEASAQLQSTSSDTITFRRSHFYIVVSILMFALGLGLGYLLWGERASAALDEIPAIVGGSDKADTVLQGTREAPQRIDVSPDDDPYYGPQDAPITIIEFSDFECPYCARGHQDTLVPLLEKFPQQVRLVYRDFPLTNIHPNAQPAAEAAQCAFAQGKFWEFHDGIFRNQSRLGSAVYFELAEKLGLNEKEFTTCVTSGRFADEVTRDLDAARDLGVTGTPTFFINGRPMVGAQPLESFVYIIEEELALK